MKQIWPNYSYSPATNVLTLTGLNIDRDQLLLVTAADRGRIMYNFADSSVTASAFTSGANTALTLVATTAGLTTTAALVIYYDDQLQSTSVSISNLPSTQTIAGTVAVSNFPSTQLVEVDGGAITVQNGIEEYVSSFGSFPISGTVTVGNTVTISGTVTANPTGTQTIAGTVTANVGNSITINYLPTISGVQDGDGNIFGLERDFPISGTVTIGNSLTIASLPALVAGTAQIGSVTASISNSVTIASLPAISGTVTANSSNGSVTTRFGSVTTANTAFATSAVTNADRKYLLIQNVTTASNVITVGIGFTPTTTQGIQLSAGAGLTFEGNYIPTGAVNLLSSVTASCFTILEA